MKKLNLLSKLTETIKNMSGIIDASGKCSTSEAVCEWIPLFSTSDDGFGIIAVPLEIRSEKRR